MGFDGASVNQILEALRAFAAGAALTVGNAMVRDAYDALKARLRERFKGRPHADLILSEYEKDADTWRAPLAKELSESGAANDPEVLRLVEQILQVVSISQQARGAVNVQAGRDISGPVTVHVTDREGREPDITMDLNTFEEMVKPGQIQAGWEIKLPRSDRVQRYLMEGWELVRVPDERGREGRIVIVDSQGRIDLVPVRRQMPGHELSLLARKFLVEANKMSDKSITLLHFDQGSIVDVGGNRYEGWEAIAAVRELATPRYIVREEGNRYILSSKGSKTAEQLAEILGQS